jgi:hypothetical protein
LVCLVPACGLAAANSSLSDSNLDAAEAKVTSEASISQNDLLRKQLSLERETQKTLTESLVVANAEAELFRRKYAELQNRVDALGTGAVSKDRAELEQRLLKAVSDLQLEHKQARACREKLLRLSEAILHYVKTTELANPEARAGVEAQLRQTNQLLMNGGNGAVKEDAAPDLMDGKIVSVKEEWSLVVANLGARQGVELGMPLRVLRQGKTIATLRVVDVRDKISGAVIQELASDRTKIRVGDRLQVDARRDVSVR